MRPCLVLTRGFCLHVACIDVCASMCVSVRAFTHENYAFAGSTNRRAGAELVMASARADIESDSATAAISIDDADGAEAGEAQQLSQPCFLSRFTWKRGVEPPV